jgi:hypothetical protein
MSKRCGVGAFLMAVTIGVGPAAAQSVQGTLVGTIADATGAVLPGATVTVTEMRTQTKRHVTTAGDGGYVLPGLDAGRYKVEAKMPGFGDQGQDAQVFARETARADFRLQVAGASEKIEVTSQGVISSDSPTIDRSISGREINSLALNFRATDNTSPIVVATLAAGVQQDRTGAITVAGGQPYQTSVSIDGISTTDVRFNGPVRDLFPSVESIQEFKVSSASNNAEFGQMGDITATSKGGTNELHGAGYWFLQRSGLNSVDAFAPPDPDNPGEKLKPEVKADSYGGTLGGPIVKNRTFFFGSYEAVRRPNETTIAQVVPPDAFRNGDLSSLSTPILNPATGQPFPGNRVPVNPTSARALDRVFPKQNQATGASVSAPNYIANVPADFTLDSFDGRVDQIVNADQRLFARASIKNLETVGTDGRADYNALAGTYSKRTELKNFALSHHWIPRQNLVNELRVGASFAKFIRTYPLAAEGGAIMQDIGIPGLPATPASGGLPNFIFTDGSFGVQTSPGRPSTIDNRTFQLGDSLTWVRDTHTFKGGVDVRHIRYRDILSFFNGDEFGEYYFTGDVTGNAFADFLLGLPSVATYSFNGPDPEPFTTQFSAFVQDEWRVTPRLTLSLGLRYDLNPPFDDKTNQLANLDRDYPGGRVVVQNEEGLRQVADTFRQAIGNTPIVTAAEAGMPETLRNTDWNNISPRIGFAYRLGEDSRTVVRGAVGWYTVPTLGSILYSLAGIATSNAPVFPQSKDANGYALVFPNVFPAGGGAYAGGLPDFRRANQLDLREPRSIQWSLSLDRNLGWNTGVRLTYMGQSTKDLVHSPDLNQVPSNTAGYAAVADTRPYPAFNAVLTRDNGPRSNYQAGTLELTKKFSHRVSFQGSYTYAHHKANANGPAPNSFSAENGPTTLDAFDIEQDYGNVAYTRRHRFVSTFFWEIPIGRGRHVGGNWSGVTNALLGGWELTGIGLFQSGPFLTPTVSGTDPSGTGVLVRGVQSTQRPDQIRDGNLANPTAERYFDAAAFAQPGDNIGRFGNAGVGTLRGPGTKVVSLTVGKNFELNRRVKLRYEAAFANVFDFENLAIPSTLNVLSPSFGRIVATQTTDQAGPRTIQMSFRLLF